MGCHLLLPGIFLTQDGICISYVSCIAGGFFFLFLTTEPRGEPVTSNKGTQTPREQALYPHSREQSLTCYRCLVLLNE